MGSNGVASKSFILHPYKKVDTCQAEELRQLAQRLLRADRRVGLTTPEIAGPINRGWIGLPTHSVLVLFVFVLERGVGIEYVCF